MLDVSGDGEIDIDEWEEAIYRGLAKRLEDLAEDRDRRERAAAKADEEFALGFLMAARQVFDTMDKDGEGIIDKSVCARSCMNRPDCLLARAKLLPSE